MDNLAPYSKTFWVSLVAGVTTGMGNGSVFGAAMMCALGRGRFDDWGGWGSSVYDPTTFMGFMMWCMLVFGFAFMAIMMVAVSRHGVLEAQARAAT